MSKDKMQKEIERRERVSYRSDPLAISRYTGSDPRRRNEVIASRMIEKDSPDMACMPKDAIAKQFPPEAGWKLAVDQEDY